MVRKFTDGLEEATALLGFLLTPAALVAFVLGCWRLTSDLEWTGEFFIHSGLLSHWQVWFAIATMIQFASSFILRLGERRRDILKSRGARLHAD
jgi:hypothetical protein